MLSLEAPRPSSQRQRKLSLKFCAAAVDGKEQRWKTEGVSFGNILTRPCNVRERVEVSAAGERGMRMRRRQNEAALGACVSGLSGSLGELSPTTSGRTGRGSGGGGGGAGGREEHSVMKGQGEP